MCIDREVVSAIDERAADDFALGIWNDRWLMRDEEVRCSYCLASQRPSEADAPLIHCDGCELIHEHFPLRDLYTILWGRSARESASAACSAHDGISLPDLIRARLAKHLADLSRAKDIQALKVHRERVEGFLEGVEAACVLNSGTLETLSMAVAVAAVQRRQELKL
ncbi:hypothetical protein SB759_05065 [Pseudomonas sp. SIMBA_059]